MGPLHMHSLGVMIQYLLSLERGVLWPDAVPAATPRGFVTCTQGISSFGRCQYGIPSEIKPVYGHCGRLSIFELLTASP